jgi:ABC-type branched-subunit amino acid transport system substrate-binding protein
LKIRRTSIVGALVAVAVAAAVVPTVSASGESVAHVVRVYRPAKTSKLNLPLVNVGTSESVGVPAASHPGGPAVLVAAARALNRAGGLHGHPVGVVYCNNKSDPNLSQSCARQFVDSHVVAVLGGLDANDQLAEPILQAANIPWIAMTPISNGMYSAQNVFIPEVPALLSYEAVTAYAYHKGYTPLVPFVQDNTGGHSLFALILDALKGSGVSYATDPAYVSPSAVDFTPYAASADRFKPGGAFALISTRLWSGILNSLQADGSPVRGLFTAPAFALSDIKNLGALGDKVITAQTQPPFDDSRMAVFLKQVKAEQARGDLNASTDTLSPNDMNSWIGFQVVIKITQGMKDVTGQNIINALHKSGPIKVAPFLTWNPQQPGPPGFTNVSNQSIYFIGFKNGKQVLLVKNPVTVQNAIAGKF